MTRKITWAPLVIASAAAALAAFACGSDEKKSSGEDAGDASSTGGSTTGGTGGTTGGTGGTTGGTGGTTGGTGGTTGGTGGLDGSTSDASDAGTYAYCTGQDPVTCGQYLVEHIDACADCHSPRLADGRIDPTKVLAGNATFADLDPTDATKGLVPTPNLTQLASQGWTVADIQNAIQNGERSTARGGGLFPIMPYIVFHNMADLDANAIAQYIHQLTPITNAIPLREPLPSPLDMMPLPLTSAIVDPATIPDPTLAATDANYDSAIKGKYLAAQAGVCMECHTERLPMSFALDMSKAFGGGEAFEVGGPFGTVTSLNITTGSNSAITGWVVQDIVDLLLTGAGPAGPICPPMPAGPGQAFGGMLTEDATNIATYIRNLPPVVNPSDGGAFQMCMPPSPPDGGLPDSGTPDGSPTDSGPG